MATMELTYDTLVTNEDYLQYTGVDLNAELTSMAINDVGDNPAPRFISGVEDYCKEELMFNYSWNGEFATDYQKAQFKKGVIHQIQYILRNGSISVDSGYNAQNGTIVPRSELLKIGMAPNAFRAFRLGGMANIRRF